MAISKKGKRRITIESKTYFWWIFDEYDQTEFDGIQIKIVAKNQSGYFKYGLEQNDNERYLVFALRENQYKIHTYCPKFENDSGIITPSGIEKLIKWTLNFPKETENRKITHAYNPKVGIIKPVDYKKTYDLILNGLTE